jgi:hypothetical protein
VTVSNYHSACLLLSEPSMLRPALQHFLMV